MLLRRTEVPGGGGAFSLRGHFTMHKRLVKDSERINKQFVRE